MGRKSSGASVDAAFDLFLDTISNAFGGIVFIALLVCVMLQLSGPAKKVKAAALERDKERAELARLLQEIETYERLVAQNQELLTQMRASTDPMLLRKFSEVKKRLAMYDMYRNEAGQTNEKQDRNLADLARLKQELYDLQQQAKLTDPQIKELQQRQAELSTSKANTGASGASTTTKSQVPVLIKNGTLTFLMNYDAKGAATGLNTIGIEETSTNPLIRAFRPRTEAGLKIRDNEQFWQQIQGRLALFDKKNAYIGFVVWPDSYDEFEIIKNRTSKMGFGYYLVLMKKDESVTTGGPAQEYKGK
jgi:hypothetical protein